MSEPSTARNIRIGNEKAILGYTKPGKVGHGIGIDRSPATGQGGQHG